MNCKSNSSENLERRLGGKVAYIYELPATRTATPPKRTETQREKAVEREG